MADEIINEIRTRVWDIHDIPRLTAKQMDELKIKTPIEVAVGAHILSLHQDYLAGEGYVLYWDEHQEFFEILQITDTPTHKTFKQAAAWLIKEVRKGIRERKRDMAEILKELKGL
jgi:hypothetical protein